LHRDTPSPSLGATDSWEGVCKLVDLKEKDGEKDKEKKVDRMRGLLFKLKSN